MPEHTGISPAFRRAGTHHALLALLLGPTILWLCVRHDLWTADEAGYGLLALRLHHTFVTDTANWWSTMLSTGPKAPLLPWIAQFFVPVGRALGDIDDGLLLVTLFASFAALVFFYHTLTAYLKDRRLALFGCMVLAGVPMHVYIGKTFYVQTLQLTAVTWFLYIMVRSSDWSNITTALHVVAAGAFAVLTMLSSVIFCVLPCLVAGYHILRTGRTNWHVDRRHAPLLALTLLLFVSALAWYGRNSDAAISYGEWSFNYAFAAKVPDVYAAKLAAWADLLVHGFVFSPALMVVVMPLVGWPLLQRAEPGGPAKSGQRVLMVLVLAQVLLVLVVFAFAAQQTYRYLLPLMAYLALLLTWCVRQFAQRWIRLSAGALFAFQFVAANLYYFGVTGYSHPRAASQRPFAVLQAIADVTAHGGNEPVLLATGPLGLYGPQAEYYSSHGTHGRTTRRRYQSIEFMLTQTPTAWQTGRHATTIWNEIVASPPLYVVVASPESRARAVGESSLGWATVMKATDDISARLAVSGLFWRVPVPQYPDIHVYRRVHVLPTHGRLDRDQTPHSRALELRHSINCQLHSRGSRRGAASCSASRSAVTLRVAAWSPAGILLSGDS